MSVLCLTDSSVLVDQAKSCCLLHGEHGGAVCEMQDGRGPLLCVILS